MIHSMESGREEKFSIALYMGTYKKKYLARYQLPLDVQSHDKRHAFFFCFFFQIKFLYWSVITHRDSLKPNHKKGSYSLHSSYTNFHSCILQKLKIRYSARAIEMKIVRYVGGSGEGGGGHRIGRSYLVPPS